MMITNKENEIHLKFKNKNKNKFQKISKFSPNSRMNQDLTYRENNSEKRLRCLGFEVFGFCLSLIRNDLIKDD